MAITDDGEWESLIVMVIGLDKSIGSLMEFATNLPEADEKKYLKSLIAEMLLKQFEIIEFICSRHPQLRHLLPEGKAS